MTRRIIVLESTNPPDGTTRYIDQVVTDADPRFDFRYLSVRSFLRRADVFHVHWPEVIVRGSNALETTVRSAALRLAIWVMRIRGTAIVRTLHNLAPHEQGSGFEQRTLTRLDEATDHFVAINPITEVPDGRGSYIPHGHYRDRFADLPKSSRVPGRLLYAGLIRPYKGVDALLESFAGTRTSGLSLRLVGKPTAELRNLIENAAANNPAVTARFGFLPDDQFVAEVSTAELVCLPYAEMHNSGMLLVALSLDCVVLVPDTPTTRALSDEVGPGWVYRFSGALTPSVLDDTIDALRRNPRSERPELADRDWSVVAARYGEVFLDAIARKERE